MKKIITTCLLLVLAVAGFQAKADAYVIGNDPFGNWNRTGGVEMTLQNGIYTVTVNDVGAGVYFAIAPDNNDDWGTVRRPSANGVAPTGEWEDTYSGTNNSWKTDVAGNYTFQYNPSDQKVKVTVAGAVVADPAMTLKGSFDEWGAGEAMTLENGKFILTKALDADAEFKFVDEKGNWWGPVSEGNFIVTEEQVKDGTELSLTTESGMNNFQIPVAGEWTFTVDPNNYTVVISGNWGEEPEKKFYIAGTFTEWADGKLEMAQAEDGSFSITVDGVETGAEFKFIDENGNWYGGDTESQSDTYGVHPEWCTDILLTKGDAGSNFKITEGQGNLTFTIKDGYLTVTGWKAGFEKGDVDGDGLVNGADVTALYNYILNDEPVNGDPNVDGDDQGAVNGADVTALYNLLLQ